eukprot:896061-Pyramimonas_sp.AAC.1
MLQEVVSRAGPRSNNMSSAERPILLHVRAMPGGKQQLLASSSFSATDLGDVCNACEASVKLT